MHRCLPGAVAAGPSAAVGGMTEPAVDEARNATRRIPGTWTNGRARLNGAEPPLLVFALLTIPAIVFEYVDQGEPWDAIGVALNSSIWLAFVAEVVIMLRVVPDRGRWLRDHPLDIAIVVLTPPFLRRRCKPRACFVCCGYCA